MSRSERRAMVVRDHPALSLSRQCRLLSLGRSSLYYEPKGESAETLALMRRIDELFLKYPFYGARRMALHLRREGVRIGRRRASQRPTVDSVALIRFHGRPCRLAFTSFRLGRSGGFAMRFPRKAGRGTRLPAIFARWKAGPAIGVSLVLAQRAKLCRFSRTSLGLRCRHRGRRSIQGVAIASG